MFLVTLQLNMCQRRFRTLWYLHLQLASFNSSFSRGRDTPSSISFLSLAFFFFSDLVRPLHPKSFSWKPTVISFAGAGNLFGIAFRSVPRVSRVSVSSGRAQGKRFSKVWRAESEAPRWKPPSWLQVNHGHISECTCIFLLTVVLNETLNKIV